MKMKEQIQTAIEYLKNISIKEPIDIRVEETFEDKITLSFTEKGNYQWQNDRIMKIFTFKSIQEGGITFYSVDTMVNYTN